MGNRSLLEKAKHAFDDELLMKIGVCYKEMGYIAEAKIQFFKALSLNDKNDELYFHIGTCYALENQWSSAFYFYKQAHKLNGQQEEYILGLANTYYQMNCPDKALPLYYKATEVAPELSTYWAHLAAFLFEQKKYNEALQVIDESEEHTLGADIYYCKAACLFRLNAHSQAMETLGEGLIEDFEMHHLFLDLCPDLVEHRDIKAIIKYYKDEK